MEDRYIAAVDLGTSKISLAVARIEGEDIQIIYYKEVPSEGIRYSAVFNPQRVAEPLKNLISNAEKELNIKILQTVVGLPRYCIKQETARGGTPRSDAGSRITKEEVDNIKNIALDSYPLDNPEREDIYGAVAQSFTTEDMIQAMEEDVVGMVSDSLEGNFKVFIGSRKSRANIDNIFNESGIAIAKAYFTPTILGKATLTYEEMDTGVALIEMGAGVTSVSIYQNGLLRHYSSIPFGGVNITSDIKLEGGLSTSLAENIKLEYGACMPDKLASMSEKIIKIMYPDSGAEKTLPVKYLSEIITCREEEIIEAILYEIDQSGLADSLRSGVVITGGAAAMTNLSNLIKEMSGYNVRIGYPLRKFSSEGCTGIHETAAAACISMILEAKNEKLLNCLDKAPSFNSCTANEASESKAYEEEEERDELILTAPKEKEEKKSKPREKSKAPTREKKKSNGLWTKFIQKTDGLMDALFDQMDEDGNNSDTYE